MTLLLLYYIELMVVILMLNCENRRNFIDDFGSEFCHHLNASSTKQPGFEYIKYHTTVGDVDPDEILSNSKYDECFSYCKNLLECRTAELNEITHNCSIFYKLYDGIKTRLRIKIYQWVPCNLTVGKYDNQNRCAGNWIYTERIRLRMSFFNYYYNSVNHTDAKKCAHYCNRNRVCGGFNFIKRQKLGNRCRFLKFYNKNQRKMNDKKSYYGFEWVCASQQTLKLNPRCSISNKGCTGRFMKVPLNGSNIPKYQLLQYNIRSYRDCLKNCEMLPICRSVLYSFTESNCFLLSNIKSKCGSKFSNKNLTTYTMINWQCCTKSSQSTRISMPKINRKCVCLQTENNIRIQQLKCKENFRSQILPRDKSSCQDAKLNCTVKQCFQLVSNWTLQQNHELIESYLLYTGYEEYLLQFTQNPRMNFTTVFAVEDSGICEFYNAKEAKTNLQKIISRKEWNADNFRSFPHLNDVIGKTIKKFVLIGSRTTNLCDCSTEEACESVLNEQQVYEMRNTKSCDFPFNFMVMQSGDVFEGLGFYRKPRSECVKLYMPLDPAETFYIGVFGNFKCNFPTLKSLRSIKELIHTAVSKGHLSEDYILYAIDYFKKNYYEYAPNLYNIIRLWKSYNGRVKVPCKSLSSIIIAMNVLSVALIMIVAVLVIKYYHGFTHSKLCSHILTELTNDGSQDRISFDLDNRLDYDVSFDVKSSITPIPPITADVKKIKIDLYNTLCFWLCDKREIDLCNTNKDTDSCRLYIENYLKLKMMRSGKVKLGLLRIFLNIRSCSSSYVTHFLYKTSSNILRKNVLVICHSRYNGSIKATRKQLDLIINNFQLITCFCKNMDLKLLKFTETSCQMDRFEIDNRIIDQKRKQKFCMKNYQCTFSGLRY